MNWHTVHNKTVSHLKAEQNVVKSLCGSSRLLKVHQDAFCEVGAEKSKSAAT